MGGMREGGKRERGKEEGGKGRKKEEGEGYRER